MELNRYLQILWKRKWVVLTTLLVTLAVVMLGARALPEAYTATSTLRILTTRGGGANNVRFEIAYADRVMNTYQQIAKSRPVLDQLRERLGGRELPEINVDIIANTELMRISATGEDPVLARDTANILSEILVAINEQDILAGAVDESFVVPDTGDPVIIAPTITLVEAAETPTSPAGLSGGLFAAFGILGGLVAGSGLAFLLENFDTSLDSKERVERVANLPVLGEIPPLNRRKNRPHVTNFIQAEEFRRLRINLFAKTKSMNLKTLLVTSGDPKEGKSTIAANLAVSIAQTELKVLMIDVDMRQPTQHKLFRLSNESGLSNILVDGIPPMYAIQKTLFPNLNVLTSGPLPVSPSELLASIEMRNLLNEYKKHFDLIILDSPAYLAVTDAAVLSSIVNTVLVVVKSNNTRQQVLELTCQQLSDQQASLVGIVMNKVTNGARHRFYNDYYTDYYNTGYYRKNPKIATSLSNEMTKPNDSNQKEKQWNKSVR